MARSAWRLIATIPFLLVGGAFAAVPQVGGCQVFPANNYWNTRVDNLPVHPSSATWVNSIGAAAKLHADWGNVLSDYYGIPYVTVPGTQPLVPITYDPEGFGDESDPGPYPIPPSAPVEGGPDAVGDRHVLVIETGNCVLYELYVAYPVGGGTSWNAYSSAKYDLKSNALRPDGWTSADAAGFPIFPGLVRWEEVAAGEIAHAIRFTAANIYGRNGLGIHQYLWPARHWSGSSTDSTRPPMGARFRLKSSFDISTFSAPTQVILRAMKKYGLALADAGSNWFFTGVADTNWPDSVFSEIGTIAGGNFEAVDTSLLRANPDSAQSLQFGATGSDYNADGNGDIVWRNSLDGSILQWLMNGTSVTQQSSLGGSGTTDQPRHVADFNGDGKADILWQDADGTVSMTLMNGVEVLSDTVLVGAGTGWSAAKTADLNGDGKADLIWVHTSGAVQAWLMNGASATAVAGFVPAGSGWSVIQVGDLDGDGKDDIIWQHTDGSVVAWLMNGLSVAQVGSFVGAGTGWTVSQLADLNGDGKKDLLWSNANGAVQGWLMNGLGVSSVASFVSPGSGWTLTHADDMNADLKADLLWRYTDGTVLTWIMNGLSISNAASFTGSGNQYLVTHLRDLNGDGRADILWKHPNGTVQAWLMNGTTVTGIAQLTGPGPYLVVP